jgi:hypothetical protein
MVLLDFLLIKYTHIAYCGITSSALHVKECIIDCLVENKLLLYKKRYKSLKNDKFVQQIIYCREGSIRMKSCGFKITFSFLAIWSCVIYVSIKLWKPFKIENPLITNRLYESYFSLLRIFLSIQFDLVNTTRMTKTKDLDYML